MLAPWPEADPALDFPQEAAQAAGIIEAVRAVRALRAEMKVEPSRRVRLLLLPSAAEWAGPLLSGAADAPGKTVSVVCPAAEILIPLGDLVDAAKELRRLEKECQGVEGEIRRAQGMLQNEGYLAKAPASLVQQTREKLENSRQMLVSLQRRMEELKDL